MEHNHKVAVILGSHREGRRGEVVAHWLLAELKRSDGLQIDFIDVAALDLPMRHENTPGPEVSSLIERIKDADGFIFVTPEYNRGYPAALKQLVDQPVAEWFAKPAAIVSYGGVSGGLRAAEQLRQVLGELHVVVIRDALSFHGIEGAVAAGFDPGPEVDAALGTLVERLSWWMETLSPARQVRPYRP